MDNDYSKIDVNSIYAALTASLPGLQKQLEGLEEASKVDSSVWGLEFTI
jgi:hypothetical protein